MVKPQGKRRLRFSRRPDRARPHSVQRAIAHGIATGFNQTSWLLLAVLATPDAARQIVALNGHVKARLFSLDLDAKRRLAAVYLAIQQHADIAIVENRDSDQSSGVFTELQSERRRSTSAKRTKRPRPTTVEPSGNDRTGQHEQRKEQQRGDP